MADVTKDKKPEISLGSYDFISGPPNITHPHSIEEPGHALKRDVNGNISPIKATSENTDVAHKYDALIQDIEHRNKDSKLFSQTDKNGIPYVHTVESKGFRPRKSTIHAVYQFLDSLPSPFRNLLEKTNTKFRIFPQEYTFSKLHFPGRNTTAIARIFHTLPLDSKRRILSTENPTIGRSAYTSKEIPKSHLLESDDNLSHTLLLNEHPTAEHTENHRDISHIMAARTGQILENILSNYNIEALDKIKDVHGPILSDLLSHFNTYNKAKHINGETDSDKNFLEFTEHLINAKNPKVSSLGRNLLNLTFALDRSENNKMRTTHDKLKKEREAAQTTENQIPHILDKIKPEHVRYAVTAPLFTGYNESKENERLRTDIDEIQKLHNTLGTNNKDIINWSGKEEVLDPTKFNENNPPHIARPSAVLHALKVFDSLPVVLKDKLKGKFKFYLEHGGNPNSTNIFSQPGSPTEKLISDPDFHNKRIAADEPLNIRQHEHLTPGETSVHMAVPFHPEQQAHTEVRNGLLDAISSHIYHESPNTEFKKAKASLENTLMEYAPTNKQGYKVLPGEFINKFSTTNPSGEKIPYNPQEDYNLPKVNENTLDKQQIRPKLLAGHLFSEIMREVLNRNLYAGKNINTQQLNPNKLPALNTINTGRTIDEILNNIPFLAEKPKINPTPEEITDIKNRNNIKIALKNMVLQALISKT